MRTALFIQKGCIFITKNLQAKTQGPSPGELARLISGAQKRDQACIDELCLCFRPLIYKEGRRQSVYNALGEDGVNIAWVIFLKFIYRYNGADYENLPGLIRCHLRYELLHAVQRQGAVWDGELNTDIAYNSDADCTEGEDTLQCSLDNIALAQAMSCLPVRHNEIIKRFYINKEKAADIASAVKISERKVFYLKKRILKSLHHQLLVT